MRAATKAPVLELMDCWDELAEREKRVLAILAQRLLMGQRAYGELHKGKLNGAKETFQEACDASIYTANAMLDLMDVDEAEAVTQPLPKTEDDR